MLPVHVEIKIAPNVVIFYTLHCSQLFKCLVIFKCYMCICIACILYGFKTNNLMGWCVNIRTRTTKKPRSFLYLSRIISYHAVDVMMICSSLVLPLSSEAVFSKMLTFFLFRTIRVYVINIKYAMNKTHQKYGKSTFRDNHISESKQYV